MEYQDVDTGILIEHGFNFLNPRVFNGQNYVAKHFFAHFCKYFCLFANYNYFYAN